LTVDDFRALVFTRAHDEKHIALIALSDNRLARLCFKLLQGVDNCIQVFALQGLEYYSGFEEIS